MGKKERKAREKEQRRNQIIDAAEKIIFSEGIEKATMKGIAEQAELSKGTLYLYFKNKDELYMAIVQRGSEILNQRFAHVFSGNQTGIELIRMIGETYLDFVHNNPDYFKAFKFYESISDIKELNSSKYAEICEANRREGLNYMIRALQIGMQDGTIDDSYDARELAVILWSSTRGITSISHMKEMGYHFKMLDELDIPVDSLFEDFLKLVGTGIASAEARKHWMNGGHKSQEL